MADFDHLERADADLWDYDEGCCSYCGSKPDPDGITCPFCDGPADPRRANLHDDRSAGGASMHDEINIL